MSFHSEQQPELRSEETPVDDAKARASDYRWGGFLAAISFFAVAVVVVIFALSEPRSWEMLLAALPFLVLARYGLVLRRKSMNA